MEVSNKGRLPSVGKQHGNNEAVYSDAENEFIIAVQAWKSRTGTRFPAATEYLAILLEMGYRKKNAPLPTDHDFKLCPACGGVFPLTLEYWHRDIYKKHGVASYCKLCRRRRMREQSHKRAGRVIP